MLPLDARLPAIVIENLGFETSEDFLAPPYMVAPQTAGLDQPLLVKE